MVLVMSSSSSQLNNQGQSHDQISLKALGFSSHLWLKQFDIAVFASAKLNRRITVLSVGVLEGYRITVSILLLWLN
jgi:hypothetical protein